MGIADVWPIAAARSAGTAAGLPEVAVLEDDAELADLAAELCGQAGLRAATYPAPAPFLADYRDAPPRVVILDWRLERELGAAVFLAVRHRFGDLPIVCWTSTPPDALPAMVAEDARTRVVPKVTGIDGFESALRWALDLRQPAPPQEKGAAT